jgi:hypothetical protein
MSNTPKMTESWPIFSGPKIEKKLQLKKKLNFFDKKLQFTYP